MHQDGTENSNDKATLADLWAAAMASYVWLHGPGPSALQLARDGHTNAVAIVENEIADHTGCDCGDDETCLGYDPARGRVAECLRLVLQELVG